MSNIEKAIVDEIILRGKVPDTIVIEVKDYINHNQVIDIEYAMYGCSDQTARTKINKILKTQKLIKI